MDAVVTVLVLSLLGLTCLMTFTLHAAVARLDRKLSALIEQSGADLSSAAAKAALPYLQKGEKIQAVKVYREMAGVSLAEAKEAVEKL